MAKKLKVWCGRFDGVTRMLICATSIKHAIDLMQHSPFRNFTAYELKNYGGITGNKHDLAIATEAGVWRESRDNPWNYVRIV